MGILQVTEMNKQGQIWPGIILIAFAIGIVVLGVYLTLDQLNRTELQENFCGHTVIWSQAGLHCEGRPFVCDYEKNECYWVTYNEN